MRNVHLLHQVLVRGHWNSHWNFWERLEWCSFQLVSHFEGWMFRGVLLYLFPLEYISFCLLLLHILWLSFVISIAITINIICQMLRCITLIHWSYMIHIQRCIICNPYISFVTRLVTSFIIQVMSHVEDKWLFFVIFD